MMNTFREFFSGSRMISNLGALKFKTSVFRDESRTPHWEMDKALTVYEQRPQVNSGINQMVSFIIGEDIISRSEDEKSQEFLQKWLDQRPRIKREIRQLVTSGLCTGNAYLEPSYIETANKTPVIDNIFSINDSSRVYYNLDVNKTDNEYWIYEVPIEIKVFPFAGSQLRPKFYRINYVRGSILFQKMVYGITIHRTKLRHLKLGWSRDNIYGRSFLASVIDDSDIIFEILKNLAIISRSRALNIKLLSIGSEEDKATPEDILKLESDFKTRREEEHLIVNKPVKEISLSHQGQYDTMDNVIDWMRKDVGSGLVPNFLTPWNSEVNRATASEIKIPFQLEIDDYRQEIINFLNETIIGSLRQAYSWLAQDLSIDFQKVDLTSQEEKMNYASQMFINNALTLNEYRMAAGYDRLTGGDKFANQLPTPPVDQISYTMRPQADVKKPKEVPSELPTETEKLGPYTPKGNLSETAIVVENGVDEKSLQEVFKELFDTAREVYRYLKNHLPTRKIKTLEGKDKAKVQELIYNNMDKSLERKMTAEEFRNNLNKEIQKYEKGKPKYAPEVVERIARTELVAMRELRNLTMWKEQGFKKVKHVTHVTLQSGKKDKLFNEKIFEIEHLLMHEEDRVPLHPNCRCTYVPYE